MHAHNLMILFSVAYISHPSYNIMLISMDINLLIHVKNFS